MVVQDHVNGIQNNAVGVNLFEGDRAHNIPPENQLDQDGGHNAPRGNQFVHVEGHNIPPGIQHGNKGGVNHHGDQPLPHEGRIPATSTG